MFFPIKNYRYILPKPYIDVGGFGTKRKYDYHTGVDLYCDDGENVHSITSGFIKDIIEFTGFKESPWWEDTYAVVIQNGLYFILYGEIIPKDNLKIGDFIYENEKIGRVKRVLKKDKGVTPTSMLHIELYTEYKSPVWWKEQKPANLKNPTALLLNALIWNKTNLFLK